MKMKHLKITLSSLFLLLSVAVWASGPQYPGNAILSPDTNMFQNASASPGGGPSANDLAKYGISVPFYKRLQWGIKMGVNVTSNAFSGTQTPNFLFNPEFGPVVGPTLAVPFGNYFGVRLEILYSQIVFSGQSNVEAPYLYNNTLNYLDIPLMLQIKPFKNFCLLAGGDVALLLSSTYNYVQGTVSPMVQQGSQNSNAKSTVTGYVFGVDYSIYNIAFGFRITGGVPNNNTVSSQNTLVGQFTVGYVFQYDNNGDD